MLVLAGYHFRHGVGVARLKKGPVKAGEFANDAAVNA
jgi:hypothetical protein